MLPWREAARGPRPGNLNSATLRTLCEPCGALRDHAFRLGVVGTTRLLECTACGNLRGLKPDKGSVDG